MKVKDIVTDFAEKMRNVDVNDTNCEIHCKMKQIDFEILCNLPEDIDLKTYLKIREICLMDLFIDDVEGLEDLKERKKDKEVMRKYIDEVVLFE